MNILARFAILAVLVVAAAPAKGRKGRQPASQHVVAANSSIALIAPTRSGGGSSMDSRIDKIFGELTSEDEYLDMLIATQEEHITAVTAALDRINRDLDSNPNSFGSRTADGSAVSPATARSLSQLSPDTTQLQADTDQLVADVEASKETITTRQADLSVRRIFEIDKSVESATAQQIEVTLANVGNKPSPSATAPGSNLKQKFDATATKHEEVKAKYLTWLAHAEAHGDAVEACISNAETAIGMD